ncbi:MAG: TolC family protein, partial [Desulfuromonadales bacterium]
QLYDEFETRLVTARATISELLGDQRLLEAQISRITKTLPSLEEAAKRAREAFDAGDIDETTYITLQSSLVNKRIEAIKLEQSGLEQRLGLQTLLGSELPVQQETTP